MKLDLQIERYIINKYISIPKLMDFLGLEYRVGGNIFCPFHENHKTPAAHLYADDNDYRIWCFYEGRMFGSWNLYKTYLPKINTNELAKEIFNKLPSDKQKQLLDSLGVESSDNNILYIEALKKFRSHKIDYKDLVSEISDCYIDEA